jgi:ProP effector
MGPAACAARLVELFPALFGSEGPPRPVKLRIHVDIQQRVPGVFARKTLSVFLHRHTTGNAYLRALLDAPHRFDLDGQPAGEVAQEHRDAAREELERRHQIHRARRVAERSASPGRRGLVPPQTARGAEPGAGEPNRPPRRPAERGGPRGSHVGAGSCGKPADVRRRHAGPGRPLWTAESTGVAEAAPTERDRPPKRRPDSESRVRPPVAEPPMTGAEDAARRERAALLRTYEASSLSKANFCVLKRLTEQDLETLLARARREREERGSSPNPRA